MNSQLHSFQAYSILDILMLRLRLYDDQFPTTPEDLIDRDGKIVDVSNMNGRKRSCRHRL